MLLFQLVLIPGKLREVSQIISKNLTKEVLVYSHTGFINIDGKYVYLYHGGAIGDNSNRILVDLSTLGNKNLTRYCFTDKNFDFKEALQTSYSFLNIANKKVTIPLMSAIYLSPLHSLFIEKNITVDVLLYLVGKSGTRKSSLTAAAMCHFGKFDREHFSNTFRDTLNYIEKTCSILKDSITVIDDYNPELYGNQKSKVFENIIGISGDNSGRRENEYRYLFKRFISKSKYHHNYRRIKARVCSKSFSKNVMY